MNVLTNKVVNELQVALDDSDVTYVIENISGEIFARPAGKRASLFFSSIEGEHVANHFRKLITMFEKFTGNTISALLVNTIYHKAIVAASLPANAPPSVLASACTFPLYLLRERFHKLQADVNGPTFLDFTAVQDKSFEYGVPIFHYDSVPDDLVAVLVGDIYDSCNSDPCIELDKPSKCGLIRFTKLVPIYGSAGG